MYRKDEGLRDVYKHWRGKKKSHRESIWKQGSLRLSHLNLTLRPENIKLFEGCPQSIREE